VDWKIFIATFSTIFIAEIGDKTQFAAIAASAQTDSTWSVLMATVLALALAGAIGVLLGSVLSNYIDPHKMRYFSAAAFIGMGIWIAIKG
jgi:putative Ca2+/H+ antiporter (TMEM165/GDT1 family)